MPNLCGVNQKQLSDALLEIKRNAFTGSSPNSAGGSQGAATANGREWSRAQIQGKTKGRRNN
jgi:hypothetical protein